MDDARYSNAKNRRAAGKCSWGGCKEVTGDDFYSCEAHRVLQREYNRRYKARLRSLKKANGSAEG